MRDITLNLILLFICFQKAQPEGIDKIPDHKDGLGPGLVEPQDTKLSDKKAELDAARDVLHAPGTSLGYYTIKNHKTGLILGASNSQENADPPITNMDNGDVIEQQEDVGADYQQWQIKRLNDGEDEGVIRYLFVSRHSGKLIDGSNHNEDHGPEYSTILHQYAWDSHYPAQQWEISSGSLEGLTRLSNWGDGLYMEVTDNDEGDVVHQHRYKQQDQDYQTWAFTKVA
jgi:hypothetical protein